VFWTKKLFSLEKLCHSDQQHLKESKEHDKTKMSRRKTELIARQLHFNFEEEDKVKRVELQRLHGSHVAH